MSRKPAKREMAQLDALKMESERALVELIRLLLAVPMNKRPHFPCVRYRCGGSHS